LLNAEACADVRPRIRNSAALSLFAMPMLRLLLSRPEFRPYATRALVMKTLRRSGELLAKRVLPAWFAQIGLKLFYRARTR
jgi:hypothetical protein